MTTIELKNINDKTKVSEKMIQKAVLDFLELNLKEKIDSEEFSEIKDYQEHTYLILKDLKKAIKNLNQNLFNEYSNKINEDQLLTLLLNDFVSKFNACKTNVDIYNLIFIMENRQCSLKILGIDKSIYYNVLDLDNLNSNNNELRIIREKRIKDSFFKELELPDFAIYINGLPFFVIELKTSDMDRTYKAAIKDYKNKKSSTFLG
jgi:type I site-specific restriction-modification system R (restriction) subunit